MAEARCVWLMVFSSRNGMTVIRQVAPLCYYVVIIATWLPFDRAASARLSSFHGSNALFKQTIYDVQHQTTLKCAKNRSVVSGVLKTWAVETLSLCQSPCTRIIYIVIIRMTTTCLWYHFCCGTGLLYFFILLSLIGQGKCIILYHK